MFLAQLPTSAACQNLNNEQAQEHGYLYKEKKSIVELMRRIRKHLTVVTIERGFL